MKRQLPNVIYGLKFAMKKNDFERLKSSIGKNRNVFVANPIQLDGLSSERYRNVLSRSNFSLISTCCDLN